MPSSAARAVGLRPEALAGCSPGALGPFPVGTSSAYWPTAEEAGGGGPSWAPAAPASAAAATTPSDRKQGSRRPRLLPTDFHVGARHRPIAYRRATPAARTPETWSGRPRHGARSAAFFWIAYDNGSFGLASRSTAGDHRLVGVHRCRRVRSVRGAGAARGDARLGGLIAALALWTLASLFWTPNAEGTFEEFNRTSLYLGAFITRRARLAALSLARLAAGSLGRRGSCRSGTDQPALSRPRSRKVTSRLSFPGVSRASAFRWATGTGSRSFWGSASRSS